MQIQPQTQIYTGPSEVVATTLELSPILTYTPTPEQMFGAETTYICFPISMSDRSRQGQLDRWIGRDCLLHSQLGK